MAAGRRAIDWAGLMRVVHTSEKRTELAQLRRRFDDGALACAAAPA